MQTLYLQQFDLPGTWDSTERIVCDWTHGRLGLDLARPGRDDAPERGSTGHRHDLHGAAGAVVRWTVSQQPPEQPDWTYHVDVWLLGESRTSDPVGADCRLRCRLSVQGPAGRLVEFDQPVGAPALVKVLLGAGSVRADGRQLGRAHFVSSTDVPALGELLLDPSRRLPVLVITPEPRTGRPVVDPQRLALRLGGLAHVATLAARPTTFAFTDLLGSRELSVFGGAVRLYWPVTQPQRFGETTHPLWLPEQLARLGCSFGDQLFVRLGRISALSLAEPRLERRGVGFRSLRESLDTTTAAGRLIFTVFAAIAEFERELNVERTRAGLAAARARGRRGGRPAALTGEKLAEARRMVDERRLTMAQVAGVLGVSRSALYRALSAGAGERP